MAIEETSRARIRSLVSLMPGLHLRQLQRILGLSFNSTRYNVQVLAKTREIVRDDDGGYSRIYPNGISESEKTLYCMIRRPTDHRILSCMAGVDRISQKELCDLTGLAKSTISEHLSKLIDTGTVKASPTATEKIQYELSDPARVRTLINAQPTLLSRATDRFIDLWDF